MNTVGNFLSAGQFEKKYFGPRTFIQRLDFAWYKNCFASRARQMVLANWIWPVGHTLNKENKNCFVSPRFSVIVSLCLSLSLSVSQSLCLSVPLFFSVPLSFCPSAFLSLCLSVPLPFCPFVFLYLCLSAFLYFCFFLFM